MAYDFPNSPTVGQVYSGWVWDGEKWVAQGGPMGAVRYDLPQGLTANQTAQARANIAVTKRNYVINGGMQISQENGTTAGTTNSYYPVDMFYISFINAATQTLQQVAGSTPGGSPNRLRITATVADATVAATDTARLLHAIEGLRAVDLKAGIPSLAKTVTIQFGVKAPAGTYCVGIGNFSANRSYVAEYVIAAGEANTDVVRSVTLQLDQTGTWTADNTGQLWISWTLMAGTNLQTPTANTWVGGTNVYATANQFNFMGTAGNVFELFDVSLTEGNVAPPFQLPDYASELALCQRYFEREDSSDQSVRPFGSGIVQSTTIGTGHLKYRTKKRGVPTLTFSAGNTFGYLISGASLVAGTAISATNISSDGATVSVTVASGLTAGNAGIAYSNSTLNAFININARL